MRTRGFTLVELLVVIAIMGLLGTAAVGGYRQMQQGMEDRGARDNVTRFMRAAYQRVKIDRQPVVVCIWNECLRSESDDESAIVVGRAVAVRRYGRITSIDGNYLIDEFCDINPYDEFAEGKTSGKPARKRLYKMSGISTGGETTVPYSEIRDQPSTHDWPDLIGNFLTKRPDDVTGNTEEGGNLPVFSFEKLGGDAEWKVGDAYGFEFLTLMLPHGYVFGDVGFSTDVRNPIKDKKSFGIGQDSTGRKLKIQALRPGSNGYQIEAKDIGTSEDPTQKE